MIFYTTLSEITSDLHCKVVERDVLQRTIWISALPIVTDTLPLLAFGIN
jgi:hypothetical protein